MMVSEFFLGFMWHNVQDGIENIFRQDIDNMLTFYSFYAGIEFNLVGYDMCVTI